MATREAVQKRERRVVSARRRVDEHDSGGRTPVSLPEGASFFEIKEEGTIRLNVIPYITGKGNKFSDEGEPYYERTYYVHRGVGPNRENHICSSRTFNRACPICDYRENLQKKLGDKKSESDKKLIASLYPKERQIFNVIDVDNPEKGIQIWEYSYHLFGKHLDKKIKRAEEDEGYEMFADLEKGFVLKIGATEREFESRTFYECNDIEFKPRKEPLPDSLMDEAYCLDSLLIETPYEKLKNIFQAEGDEDKEETPKSQKILKDDEDIPVKARGRGKVVDDDDDGDDDKYGANGDEFDNEEDDD